MEHVCSPCGETFETEKEYLEHKCAKTGFTPADIEHQGEGFKKISEAALKRGAAKKIKKVK
jgi:predicted  nucleic acid-binding Zn-ribbon protein